MKSITVYNQASGKILSVVSSNSLEILEANREMYDYCIDGSYDSDNHYIINGQPTERPASPVTLSDLTLQGVPAGSTLTINGERYENVAGDVELEFPLAGVYSLRVECWPYKDWEGEVVVP